MAHDVHQCPRCELRFTNTSELGEHFRDDHAEDPEVFTRFRYPAARTSSEDPRRRILLVANQTLEGEHVVDTLTDGVQPARIFVLVPATRAADLATPVPPGIPAAPAPGDDDVGVALARYRLSATIERLRAAGVDAEGQVGAPDPFTAVVRLLETEQFDEIVLSMLPPASSRWLRADLPLRIQRHCHVPVRTLVAVPES